MKSSLRIGATMVADEFIDKYMPEANGEYVKVYLYLLRHQDRTVTVLEMADALDHTESDIRRALAYWERQGVLSGEADGGMERGNAAEAVKTARKLPAEGPQTEKAASPAGMPQGEERPASAPQLSSDGVRAETETAASASGRGAAEDRREAPEAAEQAGPDGGIPETEDAQGTAVPASRPSYTPEQMKALSDREEDFSQLLYIAQKYLNTVFTSRECEVFAYLYDGLKLPPELLEYLVEYCVQNGHTSIRYLETVGLNWHKKGIRTVEAAKRYTASFSAEGFAVMRAFGLNDRRPGDSEMDMIRRWFREWGFSRELVLEACARTLKATNKPSFAYADRILMEWRKCGIRTMDDVRRRDEERSGAAQAAASGQTQPGTVSSRGRDGGNGAQSSGQASRSPGRTAQSRNRFHNFEQRDTDYDAIVLRQLKDRLKEQ